MKKLALILASFLIGTTAHAAALFTETNITPGDGQSQNFVTEQSPSGGNTDPHVTQTNFPVPINLASNSQTGSSTPSPISNSQTGSSTPFSRFIGPFPEVTLLETDSKSTPASLPKTGPGAALIFLGAMTAALISKRN